MAFRVSVKMLLLSFSIAVSLVPLSRAANSSLPIVDLGYTRHQAIAYNESGTYYNFSSIRYALPPLGELRFAPPVPPTERSEAITNGSEGRMCPQSLACWFFVQNEFVTANLSGQPFDFQAAYDKVYGNNACEMPTPEDKRNPMESEDCLFLDVIVPKKIYDKPAAKNASSTERGAGGSPVMIYLQDGGFVSGWKEQYNPAGLIRESLSDDGEGMIYIGFNYRTGAFGWLSGSSFQKDGGLVNAALHDQRLVLNWVQRNIRLFGGDPNRVTVMGESSGGSSIMMQLTAYDNGEAPPFQQIVTQSPAIEPSSKTPATQEHFYRKFLGHLGVRNLAEARNKSSQELIDASYVLVTSQPYGSSSIGPANDGVMVPADPKVLLHRYLDRHNITALTTYASNEGVRLVPANLTTEADFTDYIDLLMAASNQSVRSYIQNELYPPVYDGTYPYTTLFERVKLYWTELVSVCDPGVILENLSAGGWATEFMVHPALHLADTPTIFWNGPGSDPNVDEGVAAAFQGYIVGYVLSGDPNGAAGGKKLPVIPKWGQGVVMGMNTTGIAVKEDITATDRCKYMGSAPWAF